MKKKHKEAHDSWDGMLPININKKSIPVIDLAMLQSEQEMFRVFDISNSGSLKTLGTIMMASLMEHYNPVAPLEALNHLRSAFNRNGYDINLSTDRLSALTEMAEGYVDFPLTSFISELYPYQIDQKYPGYRVEDDGIQKKLGYKLVARIHVDTVTDAVGSSVKVLNGEIVPQDA
jgi:hypothetical protein